MGEQLTNEGPPLRCNFWHLSAVVFVRFCVSMQLRRTLSYCAYEETFANI